MTRNQIEERFNILGLGFVCADIIKGSDNSYMPGGTCANVVAVLSSLGWNSNLIKANYNDMYNKLIDADLEDIGVKIINFKNTKKNTPRVLQIKNKDKHKFYTVCPECKRKLIEIILPTEKDSQKLEKYLSDINVLYYDRISEGIKTLNKVAKSKNIWTMYEPNSSRSYKQLLQNISDANIVKFSRDRISQNIANKIKVDLTEKENSVMLIIVTLAEDGLTFSYREHTGKFSDWINIESNELKNIIDTSGAGDWLTAGFLDCFISSYPNFTDDIEKESIIESLKNGQRILHECCASEGALGALFKSRKHKPSFCEANCSFCNL